MKKLFIISLFFVICTNLFSQFIITEGKTISADTLAVIREAVKPTGDLLINRFYGSTRNSPTREEEERFTRTHEDFRTEWNLRLVTYGGIGIEWDTGNNLLFGQQYVQRIQKAIRHLFEGGFIEYDPYEPTRVLNKYLDIENEVLPFLQDTGNSSSLRGSSLGYMLYSVTSIADMLWYFPDPQIPAGGLEAKVDSLASLAYDLLIYSDPDGEGLTGNLSAYNGVAGYTDRRMQIAASLGYAGMVLDNDDYVQTALIHLFDETEVLDYNSYPHWNKPGYFGLWSGESNTFQQGMGYSSVIFPYLAKFFTAYKRSPMYGDNLFNEDIITDMIKANLKMIAPQLHYLPWDDCIVTQCKNNVTDFVDPNMHSGFIECFYQYTGSDNELKNDLAWYMQEYDTKWVLDSEAIDWPWLTNIPLCFATNSSPINYTASMPDYLSQGTYTESNEMTIFKDSFTTIADFDDANMMYINHEHSWSPTTHEQGDQGSFSLYYNGVNLLIDPGYTPYSWYTAREWLISPYAHNSVMINPNFDLEEDTIDDIYWSVDWNVIGGVGFDYWDHCEPVGAYPLLDDYPEINPNPATREFYIENNNIEHVKVTIPYENNGDNIDVNRNYYFIDKDFYVIYDELENVDEIGTNTFFNQLHFAVSKNNLDNIILYDDGKFTYEVPYDATYGGYINGNAGSVKLYGILGSLHSANYGISDDLPQGLYQFDTTYTWEHRRLEITTSDNIDEKFITVLIPTESTSNPIEYANNNSNNYLTKLHFANTIQDIYIGIKTENILYVLQEDIRFITESSFFMVETNSIFSAISKFIINSGGELKIRDMTGTRFDDISVFDTNYNAEEVIADWMNNELHITFKTELNDSPKYRILHYGTTPENLFSKTEFGTYHPGTEPGGERGTIENNIQNLAYDNEYFYVNYSIDELVSENVISDELVIYQGSYSNITVPELLTLGTGDLLLSEPWFIPENCELNILPSANLELNSNFDLTVDGQLTAIGTEEQRIIFDKASTSNWGKISINSEGRADLEFCEIKNSIFPINNKGYVDIKYSEFTDCNIGIFLDNPSGYVIENSIISNCGNFGILLRNTHRPIYRSILRNNLISENNFGIWFYNASAYVVADTIFANKYSGVYCTRGSNPVILSSSISATYYNSSDNPEIKIGGSSYPVVDRNRNDIIFNDGYSIYNMDTEPRDYRCSENWWGTINELAIYNSFYPTNWLVDFTPFSNEPNVGYEPPFGTGSLYREGLAAEIIGDSELAKMKYIQSIEENPDDIDAILSATRLINCSETFEDYSEIKEYYEDLQEDLPDGEFSKSVKLNDIFCTRKQGNYQEALTEYEILAETEQTFLDSIFTQLDIVYTYMDANSGGGRSSNIRFLKSKNELRNYSEAKERETELWEFLDINTEDGGIYSPEISKISLNRNYPNPFNPSTTISFSIPEPSKVFLTIYNVKGQKVKTLINNQMQNGKHSIIWNGDDKSGELVCSGVYYYKLTVNGKTESVKKCILMK